MNHDKEAFIKHALGHSAALVFGHEQAEHLLPAGQQQASVAES